MHIELAQTVRLSLDSIRAQKFRSGLTILGIVIGITTVVTVASMLSGLREGIITFFRELGPDNVFVMRTTGPPDGNLAPPKERRRTSISYASPAIPCAMSVSPSCCRARGR